MGPGMPINGPGSGPGMHGGVGDGEDGPIKEVRIGAIAHCHAQNLFSSLTV